MDIKSMLEAGFDRSLTGLDLLEVGKGRVRATLTVCESVQNFFGKLHGGAIATLIDDIGTIAVVTADHFRRAGVTTDLNVSYLAAGEPGDAVLIEAEVLRCGLTLAVVDVEVRRRPEGDKPQGELIACGRMTKFLGDSSRPRG
ncbi:PaaI family thioesterase [Sorangium sp. So ce291]|uniref:PaaI family thioesterase n=1 Tax=Sorangium sp. So ce291 TaxID=3133294 RepID=UPI003F635134